MKTITSALAAVAATAAAAATLSPQAAAATCDGTPTYRVTFSFNWTAATHPRSFVPSAHFSPVNVAVHTGAYSMWLPAGYATPGMKDVAETGSPAALRADLDAYAAAGHVSSWAGGPAAAVPPVTTEVYNVTANGGVGATLLSGATMLAPSPDWFLGMYRVSLCNGTEWLGRVGGGLGLWDAGTDSGVSLLAADEVTAPPTTVGQFRLANWPLLGQEFGTWEAEML